VGTWAGAIADYTQVIQLAGDARAYFNRGIARYRLEDYEGAVADYTQALGLNPQWAVAYYNRGNAYRQLNQQQQAIEDYSRAIELNPEDVRAYFNRGVVRGHLGDAQGAAADFSEGDQAGPSGRGKPTSTGEWRGSSCQICKGPSRDYTQALQLDPRHGKAYYHRGLARQALGDPQGAVEDFSQAISLRATEATARVSGTEFLADLYLQRAMAYLSSNTLEPALADCEQALRLDPNLSRAYLCRGLARQGLGGSRRRSGRLQPRPGAGSPDGQSLPQPRHCPPGLGQHRSGFVGLEPGHRSGSPRCQCLQQPRANPLAVGGSPGGSAGLHGCPGAGSAEPSALPQPRPTPC
jgi:tetratricopeptide (TPR) repeat protein